MESFGRQYGFETLANQRNSQSPGRFGGGRTFQSYENERSDFHTRDSPHGPPPMRGHQQFWGNTRGGDLNARSGGRPYEHNRGGGEGTGYESNRGGSFGGGRDCPSSYESGRGESGFKGARGREDHENDRSGHFGGRNDNSNNGNSGDFGRSSYPERGDSFPSQHCDSRSEMSSRLGSPEGSLEQSSFRRVLVKDDPSNEYHSSPPRSSNAHAGGNTTGGRGGSAKRPFNQHSPSEGETVPEEDPMQRQIREPRLKRSRQVADISDVFKPTIKPIDSTKPLVPRRGLKSILQAKKKFRKLGMKKEKLLKKIQRLLMKKEDLLKKMARPDCEEKERETAAHVLVSIDEALDMVRDVLKLNEESMKNQLRRQ